MPIPIRHWELDADGQPTEKITERATQIRICHSRPKPKKRRRTKDAKQDEIVFQDEKGISTAEQQYDTNALINEIRGYVDQWRQLPNPDQWQVTPETARLLQHWRHLPVPRRPPFFCQIEAVETAIWLTEVAPQQGERGKKFLDYLQPPTRKPIPNSFASR